MRYLQQVTAYVDTRDRDAAGGAAGPECLAQRAGRELRQAVGVADRPRPALRRARERDRGRTGGAARHGRVVATGHASLVEARRSAVGSGIQSARARRGRAAAGAARGQRALNQRPATHGQRVSTASTATSTSGSRISFAGRARHSRTARELPAVFRRSERRARRRVRARRVSRAARRRRHQRARAST